MRGRRCPPHSKSTIAASQRDILFSHTLHEERKACIRKQHDTKTKKTKLHEWLTNNEELKLIIVPRIKYLTPYTRESLIFLFGHGIIEFNSEGEIVPVIIRTKKFHQSYTEEITDIFSTAGKLGTWINTFPSEKITYTFFGIKP
jgi:hypothetical protein